MSRYLKTLTEAEVREALTDWLQARYSNRTAPNVVYFSHDLLTGTVLIETNTPIPAEEDEDA